MSLETAVDALVTLAGTLTGLTRMYADPPPSISEFPCGMAYIESGEYSQITQCAGRGDHNLILIIYESNTVTPQAIDRAKRWPDLVRTLLRANLTLSGTVSYIGSGGSIFAYRAGPLPYNDILHYGVRFVIPIKIDYLTT